MNDWSASFPTLIQVGPPD